MKKPTWWSWAQKRRSSNSSLKAFQKIQIDSYHSWKITKKSRRRTSFCRSLTFRSWSLRRKSPSTRWLWTSSSWSLSTRLTFSFLYCLVAMRCPANCTRKKLWPESGRHWIRWMSVMRKCWPSKASSSKNCWIRGYQVVRWDRKCNLTMKGVKRSFLFWSANK